MAILQAIKTAKSRFLTQYASACLNVLFHTSYYLIISLTYLFIPRFTFCGDSRVCFSCHTIHHSKHRFCLIRVYVRFATEQPSFSQQNSSLLLLSSLYPLFSSNLFSSRPPFQLGSSWIDISEPPKGGGRRRDSERRRERERRMQGRRLQMQTEGGTEKVKERKE